MGRKKLDSLDSDADWMALAEKLAPTTPIFNKTQPFIPGFPLAFLQAILPAGDAVPVLLIALAEMRKRGVSECTLGINIFKQLNVSSRRTRSRLLNMIAKLPPNICRLQSRRGRPHLLIIGPEWPRSMRR